VTTASETAGLHAEHIVYAYERRNVVQGVSFGVQRGSMAALAGPNGSGKTTLLKLLSGVRRPQAGRVTLDGEDVTRISSREIARHIAVLSQHVDPKLMFTVADVVAMGRSPYAALLRPPTSEDRQATEEALAATDTERFAHRRFAELSGGEQQRVMLAMALAQSTDFLLLDEPTVHLDLQHQHEFLELLHTLQSQRGIGVLAVMHDLNLAALYFERLSLMQDGQLVTDGPVNETLRSVESLAIFRAPLSIVTHPQAGVPQVLLQRRS
jgi:iron complex transport system ATP-binding protein